ncbi:MAG: radical SAM protein, partial [Paracraurococcus sp.]
MPDGLNVSAGMLAPRKGRGAVSNPAVRFESTAREAFDDGWGSLADLADLPPLPTTLIRESAKSAMAWNDSPDIGFDR